MKLTPMHEVLKNFIKEFFPFEELREIGFYDESIHKDNYEAQAKRICEYFGYKTIYEYGAEPVNVHLTYDKDKRPENAPLFLHIPSIYD